MESIDLLKRLGFTEYESRAYVSLAKLGPSTVREIVLYSKLPRNKAYEALQKLEDKGKVESLPLSPKKFKVIDPKALRSEIKDMNAQVELLIQSFEAPVQKDFKDLFWVIKGRKALLKKFLIVNAAAKKEIISCSDLNCMLYKNMRVIKEATKRGVKVKFITPFKEEHRKIYRAWIECGVKIKVFDHKKFGPLIPRIMVADGNVARLTVGIPEVKSEEDYITLWTESVAFATMLRSQFTYMWKQCKGIEQYL